MGKNGLITDSVRLGGASGGAQGINSDGEIGGYVVRKDVDVEELRRSLGVKKAYGRLV